MKFSSEKNIVTVTREIATTDGRIIRITYRWSEEANAWHCRGIRTDGGSAPWLQKIVDWARPAGIPVIPAVDNLTVDLI